jgi:hypothetical protein
MKEKLQTKLDDYESRYDFSATEWTGLEARLDRRDFWRRGALALLAGLFLLGLIGSSVALWHQNKVLSQRLSTMETVVKSATEKTATTAVLGQTDTDNYLSIRYHLSENNGRRTAVFDGITDFSP